VKYQLVVGANGALVPIPKSNGLKEDIQTIVYNSSIQSEHSSLAVKAKKGNLIVTISDTTMTEGKVFVHKSTGKQIIKLKFEISDNTNTKIAYQITTFVESTKTNLAYPKNGYDTLTYNQLKEVTLDSLPQGKYTLSYNALKKEEKTIFFIRKEKLEITETQLKAIFPNTNVKRIKEVVEFINKHSADFEISTPERMAHFIGQIGAETGALVQLKENPSYPPRTIAKHFHTRSMVICLKRQTLMR
jgi:hypothetical protein